MQKYYKLYGANVPTITINYYYHYEECCKENMQKLNYFPKANHILASDLEIRFKHYLSSMSYVKTTLNISVIYISEKYSAITFCKECALNFISYFVLPDTDFLDS